MTAPIMTGGEIIKQAEAFGLWYHTIALFPGYTTPTRMVASFPQWEQVRAVRNQYLKYGQKSVLDLGTMDGMWAFDAEALGAGRIVAADIWQGDPRGQERFEFAHRVLKSKVDLWPGVNAHHLSEAHYCRMEPPFDIIQCLGLLYHVQNPLLVLHNLAHCLQDGGELLLETACLPFHTATPSAPIMRFNSDEGIYCDPTTFWAPNWNCLVAMLNVAGFGVRHETVSRLAGQIERVCCVCVRDGQPDPKYGLE